MAKSTPPVSADRVNEVLSYDERTGLFRWKVKLSDRCPAGFPAGGFAAKGYWRIKIDGRYYLAHRLAWLMVTGAWPKSEIDHKNRVRNDNRWDNLRAATHSQNHANTAVRADNKTGFKGVQFSKQKGKFLAVVVKDGERHHAGYHVTKLAAHEAYVTKACDLHGAFSYGG